MIYIFFLSAAVLLVLAFFWWLLANVKRGKFQRDEKLLAELTPIGEKLMKNEQVNAIEIQALSRRPELRPMLYGMLKSLERLELFPAEALTLEAQGTGILSRWMMHPNEFETSPSKIELVEDITRELANQSAKFLVFRFQMPQGHWAGDGWILGLAGPFFEGDEPYGGFAAGFARYSDKLGEKTPAELVDRYLDLLKPHLLS